MLNERFSALLNQLLEIAALPPIEPTQAATNGNTERAATKRARPPKDPVPARRPKAAPSVIRLSEATGSSPRGWEDAVTAAVKSSDVKAPRRCRGLAPLGRVGARQAESLSRDREGRLQAGAQSAIAREGVTQRAMGRRVPSVAVLDTPACAPKNPRSVAETEVRDVLTRVLIANDGEVLSRLRLSAAEAARVCNVTPRQLIYWTKKGLVKPSTDGEHDYDVYAMEKVIRIRQALAKGYSLEKAAQLVQRDLASLQTDAKRLDDLAPEDLEGELRRRLERLEERVVLLRRNLPTSLSVARLRRAVAELARLETMGELREGAERRGREVAGACGSVAPSTSSRSCCVRSSRSLDRATLGFTACPTPSPFSRTQPEGSRASHFS